MSALRKRKIEQIITHAKKVLPKLKAQISKDMQNEINTNPMFQYMKEKPTVNETELAKRLKDALNQELWRYALKEFPENNRKTLREYIDRALTALEHG